MKLSKLTEKKWNYKAIAFAIPFFGMLLVMLFSQYTPFGNYSMLYSDMYHQYYPFFVSFRDTLRSGGSLIYNWDIGLGMDYLGLISYYLASPLNLLSILVPKAWLLPFFSFLVPMKLGLASMFFAIFLKKTFRRDDLSVALFGCFYGMCAWALGYQWNVMWLDTFALLPLVVWGMVSLIREKKVLLYTFTLFFSIATNYYIGLFTCIFVFLVFFCYEICRWRGFRPFLADLCRIALFSGLAIAMTAFLELPTLAALQSTQSSVNNFPKGFKLNIASKNTWRGLFSAMGQVAGNMNGGLEPTFKEGLPNLYCGVIATTFAFLFLMAKQVKLKDKLCAAALLIFFNLSFIIRQLDYIWHGFHFTNMIPYRFSFLYSFVMLYMAYRAYTLRRHFQPWKVVLAFLLSVGLIFCSNWKSPLVWVYNGSFLLLYTTVLVLAHFRRTPPEHDPEARRNYVLDLQTRRRKGTVLLLGIMAVELTVNLVNFAICFPGTYVANYPKGTTDAAAVIRHMNQRESDTPFFRAETTHSQTLNDGALNGYNGISTFTSSANFHVTEFMKALGYGAKNTYNRYCFEESSPVSNLFLGLKYMLERQGELKENAYFDDVYSSGQVHLLENNAYLPLGFLAESQLMDLDFKSPDKPFEFQNKLFAAATGLKTPVWNPVLDDNLVISSPDVTLNSTIHTSCSYTSDAAGTIIYDYTADSSGLMCIQLDLPKRNNFTVYKNGTQLYSETYSLPQMLSVANVVPGDVIEIKLSCQAKENGNITIQAAILDDVVFRKGYEILSASTLELTSFRDTHLEGTINCDRPGLLYTSIPQNGNWHVQVDGSPAETVLIGGAMTGVLLPEGYHEISFTYQNPPFSLGWKVSLLSLALVVLLYFLVYRPKNYQGKYARCRNS